MIIIIVVFYSFIHNARFLSINERKKNENEIPTYCICTHTLVYHQHYLDVNFFFLSLIKYQFQYHLKNQYHHQHHETITKYICHDDDDCQNIVKKQTNKQKKFFDQ